MPAYTLDGTFKCIQGIHTGFHIMNIQPYNRFNTAQSIEFRNALDADGLKPLVQSFADIR
jgi:hypothetical protein